MCASLMIGAPLLYSLPCLTDLVHSKRMRLSRAVRSRQGRPVLQNGLHEEISAERKISTHGKLQMAGFHDDNRHVAVFGRGSDLPAADYFLDNFSNGFAYDGGSSSSWGT